MDVEEATRSVRSVDGRLSDLLRIAQQTLRARAAQVVEAEGLTLAHYVALSAFELVDEISSADLARVLDVTPQASNLVVHRLVENRWLLRRPEAAGRTRLLRLSHKGRALLDRITPGIRQVEDQALAGLSSAEEQAVRRWLSDLAKSSTDDSSESRP